VWLKPNSSALPDRTPAPRGQGIKRSDPHPEEQAIIKAAPEIAGYVQALKQSGRKYLVIALRQLLRMIRDYPREPVLAAVEEAAHYGLYDLDRLERMISAPHRARILQLDRLQEKTTMNEELDQLLKISSPPRPRHL